jgi:hypothetical protein
MKKSQLEFFNEMPFLFWAKDKEGRYVWVAKDAPVSPPIHRTGSTRSNPILGGLHHPLRSGLGFGTHRTTVGSHVSEAHREDST